MNGRPASQGVLVMLLQLLFGSDQSSKLVVVEEATASRVKTLERIVTAVSVCDVHLI